jgi:dimethylsulfone monooxygenase
MLADATAQQARNAMYNRNALKLGLFASNCSSGRAATKVPERWDASWKNNRELARVADAAGIDFFLPIGRWKGYPGETNFEGSTFETIAWACGLLGATERLTVFGTVHAPLVHPVYAAKQMVTADHIGEGRFGLNIVCGWNEDEFAMFGVDQLEHDARYDQGDELISTITKIWERDAQFNVDGAYFQLHGVRADPKPYGGTRPLIMNAGSSAVGRAFGLRRCDFLFRPLRSIEQGTQDVADATAAAAAAGREIGCFTAGYVVCRPTMREAEEYVRYYADEQGDWEAVDHLVTMGSRHTHGMMDPEVLRSLRIRYAAGHGGFPMVGTPDHVAGELAKVSAAGFTGIAFSFVNYLAEFPYFRDEVLPRLERLGIREPVASGPVAR